TLPRRFSHDTSFRQGLSYGQHLPAILSRCRESGVSQHRRQSPSTAAIRAKPLDFVEEHATSFQLCTLVRTRRAFPLVPGCTMSQLAPAWRITFAVAGSKRSLPRLPPHRWTGLTPLQVRQRLPSADLCPVVGPFPLDLGE